jgi:hypothetical protein
MRREPQLQCSTCGQFIRAGEQSYVADEEQQPIYVNGDMLIECPTCDEARARSLRGKDDPEMAELWHLKTVEHKPNVWGSVLIRTVSHVLMQGDRKIGVVDTQQIGEQIVAEHNDALAATATPADPAPCMCRDGSSACGACLAAGPRGGSAPAPDARGADYDWRADWQSVLMFLGCYREKLPEYPANLHAAIGRLTSHSGGVVPSIWADVASPTADARDQEIERLRAVLEPLEAWATHVMGIVQDRRIPSADSIADGNAILAMARAALAAAPASREPAD